MKLKYICLVLTVLLITAIVPLNAFGEEPLNIYYGDTEAINILNNIDFNDVKAQGSNYWAKDAINEMAALSIIKGYGDNSFGIGQTITKTQAIALLYRAAGREEEAQQLGEVLQNQRIEEERKTSAVDMWADGYLQLAAQEGLITYNDLQDAFLIEQEELDPQVNFIKTNPAERQEIGVWLAKLFGLEPDYNQEAIFNSFNDWENADPVNVAYLESVIKEKIMNGTPEGYFYPNKGIKREEMAQVLKNSESIILNMQGMKNVYGYIENINKHTEKNLDDTIITKEIDIRNDQGQKDRIIVKSTYDINGKRIETTTYGVGPALQEIIVSGNTIGNSDMLKEGNRIKYIVKDNVVKYVSIISLEEENAVLRGEIDTINKEENKIGFIDSSGNKSIYQVSLDPEVLINGDESEFNQLIEKSPAEITLVNNIITKITVQQLDSMFEDNEITGIVEDISPSLGYISLYDEEGKKSFNLLRIYNFDNPSFVEVVKDGLKATIYDIEPGDSVFLNVDDNNKVTHIAASKNYTVKYASILKKNIDSLVVQFEDGQQKVLDILTDTLITQGGKLASYSDINPGVNVKLILHETDDFTKLKRVVIERGIYNVEDVYKGNVYFYDIYNSTIVLEGVRKLENGNWTLTDKRGFFEVPISDNTQVYLSGQEINIKDINDTYIDMEAYIATSAQPGGNSNAVLISLRSENDEEKQYTDTISSLYLGSNEFKIKNGNNILKYHEGSIIIKNGKLITGNNISINDTANIIANRSYDEGEYYADIISIKEISTQDILTVYRGRIESIDEGQNFTVQSFSELDNYKWTFYNTPKTFTISDDTIIFDSNGVVNNRKFNDYSDKDYIEKVVSVVTDGNMAKVISEVPYGKYVFKGQVQLSYGQQITNDITLRNVAFYDEDEGDWTEVENMTVLIREDSIVMKDGTIIQPEDILRNQYIKVFKSTNEEGTSDEEALIIMVEDN